MKVDMMCTDMADKMFITSPLHEESWYQTALVVHLLTLFHTES